ncbi:putative major facilitator superfamily transporter [Gordonia hirsuta DSM 44140 = NBRC 16056]|uniref:Putative major facilitator superfamily transporter n=1 Tax=Gordonia hirsuta DSM 44140 = NBRC 16056 TaxID=1121927 RepID=L7LG15_9ACTN|nr:MFS transporter [Gordonia hirsuta]GAC58988.1 putative major facilitator superfamily transporter [Gordonia hirsuta DSM 44140 = NBRC 16056]
MTLSAPQHHPRLAVAVLCVAGTVVALMQTIIVPLIPLLPSLLDTSETNAAWTLTITLLVGAVVTPIAGRMGDMFGKRRVLVSSLAAVAVGSAVCALAPGLVIFLLGRGLQGMGIGIVAVGISLMRDIVPADRLGSAVGMMSASLGVGGALGLPFAAAIAQQISWQALFWVSGAVALAALIAVLLTVPVRGVPRGGRFDAVGALGLTVLLTCILLAFSKGAEWGWSSPAILGLFAGFAVSTALWWRWERTRPDPLINLTLNIARPVLLTNIASVATGFAFYAMQMIPIQILMAPRSAFDAGSLGMGLSMVLASLVLMPGGLVMFAFSYVSAELTRRYGARISLALGAVVIGLGYSVLLLMIMGPWPGTWVWLIGINVLVGAGLGIAYSAMPALIMHWVPVSHTGEANGVNALMRSVGTSLATAVVGMILAASMTAAATPVGPIPVATSTAYSWAAGIALAACVVAAITALAVPRTAPVAEQQIV